MTARKAITRSKKTFRKKFPSKKNQCMVHCESILESKAALYFEISPYVKSYVAQPSREIYYDKDYEPKIYFPDFNVVLFDDSELDVEVKPKSKLYRPDLKRKFEAIIHRYQEQDRRFRILTDEVLLSEPFHSNLQILRYHRRMDQKSDLFLEFAEKLSNREFSTLKDVSRIIGYEHHAYDLLAMGHLGTDFKRPLLLTNQVWLNNNQMQEDENDPFLL